MADASLVNFVLIPIGLGLLGFVEPCSMGTNLLFIKFVERKDTTAKVMQAVTYTVTRALFIGALGAGVALVGAVFIDAQKALWIVLGALYAIIGVLFVTGKTARIQRTLGPGLMRISGARGSAALGVLFGLNIPACAAPLIFAVLGTASLGSGIAQGFASLALFGFALSAPLLLALAWGPARRALDRLAALSAKVPFWTGIVFVALGLWSIYLGVFVNLEDWA
ncbi:MAG: cytochrome c biogenesis protein CcdA [Alphaproteobacteria bacterium]